MDWQEKENWLKTLKIEDKVAIIGSQGDSIYIRKICRITQTMIVVKMRDETPEIKAIEMRFSIKNGDEVGGDVWHKNSIEPYTEEIAQKIRRANLIKKVTKIVWNNLTTEALEQIHNLSIEPNNIIEEKKC